MPSGTTNRALAATVALAPPAFHCPSPAAIAMASMNALSTSACDFAVTAGATASPTVAVYVTSTMVRLPLSTAVTMTMDSPADMGVSVSIIPLPLASRTAGVSDRAVYVGSASADIVNSLLMSTITAGPSTAKSSAPASMNTVSTSACDIARSDACSMTVDGEVDGDRVPRSVRIHRRHGDRVHPGLFGRRAPASSWSRSRQRRRCRWTTRPDTLGSMESGTSNRSLRAIIATTPFGAGSQIPVRRTPLAAFATAAFATACTLSFATIMGASTIDRELDRGDVGSGLRGLEGRRRADHGRGDADRSFSLPTSPSTSPCRRRRRGPGSGWPGRRS